MKSYKKIPCLLLVLVFLLTVFPGTVSATEIRDSGACGEGVFWELTSDGVLILSGNGSMINFSSFRDTPWYQHCQNGSVKSVVFLPGVRSVGDLAFYECDSISEITLPEGLARIGEYAFYSCGGLDLVSIPASVNDIGWGAFSGCRNLKKIQVAPNNAYYANDVHGVLFTKDYSTLLSAPGALSGSYTVPEPTTSIWNAFDNCHNLLHVYLPRNLSSISEGTFRSCENLQGIWVDEHNPYFFSDALGVLYGPPHWGMQNRIAVLCVPVTLSGPYQISEGTEVIECHSFPDCSLLTAISFPESVKEISYGSFANCTGLTSISLPDSITFIDFGAFEDCSGLVRIELPDTLTSIEMSVFSGCENLTDIRLPNSLVSIGGSAFADCSKLSKITIPGSVKSIGAQAFANCAGLKEVTFLGDAPTFESGLFGEKDAFLYVTADCYYPANNKTWTYTHMTEENVGNTSIVIPRDPRQSYGGDLTWKALERKGDTNGDGDVTYLDAMIVLRSSVDLTVLDETAAAVSDVDGNGTVDYLDAMMILQASVGLVQL